ncbi:SMP-30/gluconolactonase/LRE family protein [Tenacibaculum jejuense]|uniref:Putative gluconolactonase n=1 Tax=Tenacibaculum jejuense TaxID=584609 RepID=A0A238UBT0_9FLAO|nr:SMP-30/gluconolactonase/LRE family protein [Tenacibaculum jejuense]SNR16515.1 Putative gluconolactonase [Tenacibaculum jejuense]
MRNIIIGLLAFCVVACKQEDKKTAEVAVLEYQINADLGEGAIWNHVSKELYWIDIEGKKLHVYHPGTKKNKTITLPCRIGTVVPSEEENKAIVALEDGVYIVDTLTEELMLLSDVESDITENRFNDGKCDPNGNLWVGSMHLAQNKPNANLYKINEKGESDKMLDGITISNGIVWSKDKSTMYYIDTPKGTIRAFDYDKKTSEISNERVVVTVDPKDGFPDGMAIDDQDMLWVGMWNGNAVAKYNPKTGNLEKKIQVPAHNVTSCAFGGDNFDELYITTASVDMTDEEKKQFPLAGSVFKIKLKEKGVKSNFFKKPSIQIAELK